MTVDSVEGKTNHLDNGRKALKRDRTFHNFMFIYIYSRWHHNSTLPKRVNEWYFKETLPVFE